MAKTAGCQAKWDALSRGHKKIVIIASFLLILLILVLSVAL